MPASRAARSTIRFVDEYCQLFEGLFPEVRSYEAFKLLHLGMIGEIKQKSLPAIAKAVGLDNQQNLHHFLSESPWQVRQLRLSLATARPGGIPSATAEVLNAP